MYSHSRSYCFAPTCGVSSRLFISVEIPEIQQTLNSILGGPAHVVFYTSQQANDSPPPGLALTTERPGILISTEYKSRGPQWLHTVYSSSFIGSSVGNCHNLLRMVARL